MKLNVTRGAFGTTHEGAPAARLTPEQQLRRSVLSCLLWEREFYEDGEDIATRIFKLAHEVPAGTVAELAVEARHLYHLRHVPLLLLAALAHRAPGTSLVSGTIERVVSRADELAELIAVIARVNAVTPDQVKRKLSAQVKKGLARAFLKFDEYQLAKYDRAGSVRLRDVLFLCHAKPDTPERDALWKRLVYDELATPDTWEVALSGGANKRETFERLLREEKLGYLALLRNLRNMETALVDPGLVETAIELGRGAQRVLPFRYVAAARAAPRFEPALDRALLRRLAQEETLPGRTAILVDVSGSMDWKLSERSDMTRLLAGAALAAMFPGEDVRVFSFSSTCKEVPRRLGMAGVDAIEKSQPHGSTMLGEALQFVQKKGPFDRLIVITDEQSHDPVGPPPAPLGYMINVASAQHGVGYGPWVRIDGFSERVFNYIRELEEAE